MKRVASARPLVSAVIPTRNRAHCLPRAIDSMRAQEGLGEQFNLEVIVVDDASSDATPDVVHSYADLYYIRLPERRGVGAALNVGLRASTGCYVSILGDDDEWLPHKLRTQVPELDAHPDVGVVYGQSRIRKGNEERLYPRAEDAHSGWVFEAMLMDNFAGHHASALIRRAVFDTVGYFDETLSTYEDYDLSLRIARHFPFRFVPGAVDIYNLSPRGLWLSHSVTESGVSNLARVIETALRLLPDSATSAKVKREARARAALGAVNPFIEAGDLARAWSVLIAALGTCPWLAEYEWARDTVRWLSHAQARTANSPVIATRDFCNQIKAATTSAGMSDRRRIRTMIAKMWATMAASLLADESASNHDAAYAAGCAVAHAPLYIVRNGLLRGIARGALRRAVLGGGESQR
ncbi:MAG TPA: glycosyltransferase [Candidatus Binatia bacterium]|nr:glycosyltransferase [Candidatus Binatia bacterium]